MPAATRAEVHRASEAPPTGQAPEQGSTQLPYELRFEADRVDVEGQLSELELRGDVKVVVDRYRLTSQRLHVYRGRYGLVVDGSGEVSFCPCANPPLTLGFSKATVAPPTDLLVENPTLRVGGVPVAWLPFLWLRAPTRIGLLPPRLAWRAADGPQLGSGIYLPLAAGPTEAALELRSAAYLYGGADSTLTLWTERTTSEVRWDWLRQSTLEARSQGVVRDAHEQTALAWHLDSLRGSRSRRGTVELDRVARRTDRLRVVVAGGTPHTTHAFGLAADAPRLAAAGAAPSAGPVAFLGGHWAPGSGVTATTSLSTESRAQPTGGTVTRLSQALAVGLSSHLGAVGAEGALSGDLSLSATEAGATGSGAAGGKVGARVPLERTLGSSADAWVHRVEPLVETGLGVAKTGAGALVPWAIPKGPLMLAVAGLRTALGRDLGADGLSLSVRGGLVGPLAAPRQGFAWRAVGDGSFGGLSVGGGWLVADRAPTLLSAARLGRVLGPRLDARLAGRLQQSGAALRWLEQAPWQGTRGEWLDRSGWSVGLAASTPIGSWLALSVGGDHDLQAQRLLALRAASAYRHPCGCLSVTTSLARRLGRDGTDVWVTLDLMP